jgi:hypothetical protein
MRLPSNVFSVTIMGVPIDDYPFDALKRQFALEDTSDRGGLHERSGKGSSNAVSGTDERLSR